MPVVEEGSLHPHADGWHAAGWLGAGTEFPVGAIGEPYVHRLFCERLFEACRTWSTNAMRGYQVCDLCEPGEGGPSREASRHGRIARLGNAEVRVFDAAGRGWTAPTLIYHYVVDHAYRPPDGFVDGILVGRVVAPDRWPTDMPEDYPNARPLADVDPELYGELCSAAASELGISASQVGKRLEVKVWFVARTEDPGIDRPVALLALRPKDYSGTKAVHFDGTSSWCLALRRAVGDRRFRDFLTATP